MMGRCCPDAGSTDSLSEAWRNAACPDLHGADTATLLGDVKRAVDAGSQQVKAGIQAAAGEVAALGSRAQRQWQALPPSAASAGGPAASSTTTKVHHEEKEVVTTGNPKPSAAAAGSAAEER